MRLLDKYLLRNLFVPLGYCLFAFAILIIIQDLFDHLSNFLEGGASLQDVLKFYAFLLPSLLILIVPVSLLLSVLYSLLHLTKNNELTAMRASGISLYRLMAPFLLVGLACTAGGTLVNETIGPRSAYYCAQYLLYLKHAEGAHIAQDLPYYNNAEHRDWFISRFDTKTFDMENVRVTQEWEDGGARFKTHAAKAQWLDGFWWFTDVTLQEFDQHGNPVRQFDADGQSLGVIRYEREMEMTDFTETPANFVNVTKNPEFLTSRELLQFIEAFRLANASEDAIARVKVDLHSRLAMPWMSFIVTLLGIPFGAQSARKGTITGVILSIALFFGFYFFINTGIWMGKERMLPAWFAAWFPNLLFMSVGMVLVYRMR